METFLGLLAFFAFFGLVCFYSKINPPSWSPEGKRRQLARDRRAFPPSKPPMSSLPPGYPESVPPLTSMPPTARESAMPGVRTPPLSGSNYGWLASMPPIPASVVATPDHGTGIVLDPNWEWTFVGGIDGQPDQWIQGRCKHLKVIAVVSVDGKIPAQLCTNCKTQFNVPIPTE